MSKISQKIELKVYIEGHLIPNHGVSLSMYDGQSAMGNILTTPTESIKSIPPMSTVTILYYDNNFQDWCLFFEGLYTGWQFSRTPLSRSISLGVIGWDYLLKKVYALMAANSEDLFNSTINIYAMGNSSPVSFSKGASDQKGLADQLSKSDKSKYANQAMFTYQPRGAMSLDFIFGQVLPQGTAAKDFGVLMKDLSEAFIWLNPLVFYRYIMSRMSDKTTSIQDDIFKNFLDFSTITNALNGLGNTYFKDQASAQDFIDVWMAKALYSKSTLCAPPCFSNETSSKMNQMIYSPKAFFNIPPACNTLFPEMISSISYVNNYMAHGTRLLMRTNPMIFKDAGLSIGYFYSERGEYEDSKDILDRMKGLVQNTYIGEYSQEEYEKYVNPKTIELQDSMYYTLLQAVKKGEVKADEEKVTRALGAAAHYQYLQEKYGVRPLTITGMFNPYFVVGFPCVVLDETCCFMAKPTGVVHNISASGDASTTYMCNFSIDIDKSDIGNTNNKFTKFPPLPIWLPDGYLPENINKTYSQLLGANAKGFGAFGGIGAEGGVQVDSVLIKVPNTDEKSAGYKPNRVNMASIINSVFSLDRDNPQGLYDKAEDRVAFSREYVARNVTTYSNYMDFYKMTGEKTPGETMSAVGLFKHIVDIKNVPGALVFVDDSGKATSIQELVDMNTQDLDSKDNKKIIVDTVKYKKMGEIQKSLNKTGFRG